MGRDRSTKAALGPLMQAQIESARVLMVGAGGIGCELLKNLVLAGFGEVYIVDLDTIDLSNLNRQFLFGMQHIKKSKALVAKETASKFNPNVKLVADHANIKDTRFNVDWFKGFTMVFNALDNLDARRHVNKMCLAAKVPLVESGTTGFNGQVQIIQGGMTECYDCTVKPVPKSFPVCTIRSTPNEPIHCIVWAKSYLFNELFGISEDDTPEFDHSADSENAREIQNLQREAEELKRIRETMGSAAFTQRVFEKIYSKDIVRLADMKEMWKTRKAPDALDFDTTCEKAQKIPTEIAKKDQSIWTIEENFRVFADSLARLSERLMRSRVAGEKQVLSFDKDDEDTLDFVAASANLRSSVFGIERRTKFDIKQMAGNIIPAIATTNAITAGLCVLQAFKILKQKLSEGKMVFMSMSQDRALTTEPLRNPNPECQVCGVARLDFEADLKSTKLGDLVTTCLREEFKYDESLSILHEKLIYDEDFDDQLDENLSDLGVKDGSFLTVVDESEEEPRVNLIVHIIQRLQVVDSQPFKVPTRFDIPRRPKKSNTTDTVILNGRTDNANQGSNTLETIPTKKRKADEIMDGFATNADSNKKLKATDDIIVIDDGYIEID